MNNDSNDAGATLRKIIQEGREISNLLQKGSIKRCDREEIVTAIANGYGEVIQLSIDERATLYPAQRLSDQLTSVISQARKAGKIWGDKLRQLKYPNLPSSSALETVIFTPLKYMGYEYIDYSGSEGIKNTIAECCEILKSFSGAAKKFEYQKIRGEIGHSFGYIEINVADTWLHIALQRDIVSGNDLARCCDQVLSALHELQMRASKIKVQTAKGLLKRLVD